MFQDTFKALSDPVRREILNLLKSQSLAASDIASRFDLTQASVSYHLSILKKADLIRENKQKNFIYYELNASIFQELILYLKQFSGGSL